MSGAGRSHATAIKSALTGQGLTVYEGGAPDSPSHPYVVLYADSGRALQTSLLMGADHYDHYFQTTSVGTTQEQVLWAAEKVRAALAGKTLTVSGWYCSPITHNMSARVASDYDAPTNVKVKYDEWRYRAVPSS